MSISSKRPETEFNGLFRTALSEKIKVRISFPKQSLYTKQEFRDECDINVIMAKYQATGEMPNLNPLSGQYLDVTGYDYQEHMNVVANANSLFSALPSKIRARFQNDPAQFLDFSTNPKNSAEMREMGLLRPVPEGAMPSPPKTTSNEFSLTSGGKPSADPEGGAS